ncbi:MAG: FxLYD domain-containing protein [Zoogloeaceae bacterium]|nr:FxLYD domain-containing protein [Zoogloeaceae bacterium]
MEQLKKLISTFVQGIAFGAGFFIVTWGVYFLFQGTSLEKQWASADTGAESMSSQNFRTEWNAAKKLTISNVEEHIAGDRTYFTGTVTNNGDMPASAISIEVNLFKQDKFVDQYSTYISSTVSPGESRYFKISCGCKDTPPAEHDSYKIQVSGGF